MNYSFYNRTVPESRAYIFFFCINVRYSLSYTLLVPSPMLLQSFSTPSQEEMLYISSYIKTYHFNQSCMFAFNWIMYHTEM